jgi:hypothetical protein
MDNRPDFIVRRNQVRKEARRLSDCGFGSLGKSEWAEKSWPAPQVRRVVIARPLLVLLRLTLST